MALSIYSGLRWAGVVCAAVAATARVIERVSGEPNLVTAAVEQVAGQAGWLLAGLILFALAGGKNKKLAQTQSIDRQHVIEFSTNVMLRSGMAVFSLT